MKIEAEKRYFGGWWVWILVLVVLTAAVFGGLKYFGVHLEREIFEASYQKQSSDNRQAVTWRATMAEIEARLMTMSSDDPLRPGLEGQLSAFRIQLRALENSQ